MDHISVPGGKEDSGSADVLPESDNKTAKSNSALINLIHTYAFTTATSLEI